MAGIPENCLDMSKLGLQWSRAARTRAPSAPKCNGAGFSRPSTFRIMDTPRPGKWVHHLLKLIYHSNTPSACSNAMGCWSTQQVTDSYKCLSSLNSSNLSCTPTLLVLDNAQAHSMMSSFWHCIVSFFGNLRSWLGNQEMIFWTTYFKRVSKNTQLAPPHEKDLSLKEIEWNNVSFWVIV